MIEMRNALLTVPWEQNTSWKQETMWRWEANSGRKKGGNLKHGFSVEYKIRRDKRPLKKRFSVWVWLLRFFLLHFRFILTCENINLVLPVYACQVRYPFCNMRNQSTYSSLTLCHSTMGLLFQANFSFLVTVWFFFSFASFRIPFSLEIHIQFGHATHRTVNAWLA